MAGFVVHATTALVASTGVSAYLTAYHHYPLHWGAALCALGFLGGLLPDIDSNESKIARYSSFSLAMALVLLVMTQFFSYFGAILFLIPFAKAIDMVLRKWTTHRGAFHSIPMCVLFSTIAFTIAESLAFPFSYSLYSAGFLGGGYALHLLLDEIWSLRNGIRCPSLGTGLQIFRLTFWKSFLLTYALCGALLYNTPQFREWLQKFFM
jgi:hypothetical protein